jgi:hypothetical protein
VNKGGSRSQHATEGKRGQIDWSRFDAITDEEIEESVRNDPDAPPIVDDEWFATATLVLPTSKPAKKRRSGIPTGNAGEYFVMGELLRQGFDAQLADRNTKGYDLLVGRPDDSGLRKVQVKTVRSQPWYVNLIDFHGDLLNRVTVYVLIGSEKQRGPVRFFIAKNRDVATQIHQPPGWHKHAFMPIKALEQYENRWDTLLDEP